MIPMSVGEIASVVGGTVVGESETVVSAPAVMVSAQAQPGGLFVAFAGERVDGHDFVEDAAAAGAVAVLGSRATPLPTIVVADTAAALQALATHVIEQLRAGLTIAAVTGSQGKTSTKDLLTAVFSAVAPTVSTIGNLNNELGVPLTMLRADSSTRYLVLEMGARHMGDIALLTSFAPPDVSIVLNVGHAHIGEFGSRDAIATAKGEIVQGLATSGTAVLNADDSRVATMRSLAPGRVITYGYSENADVRIDDLTQDRLGRPSFDLRTSEGTIRVALPIVGAHMAMNAAAVVAAIAATGLPVETAVGPLASASLTKWRMELHELPNGVTVLNDSYNASLGSTQAAIDALAAVDGSRHIAVIGEILELGDESAAIHHTVGEYASTRADIVIAIGANAAPVAESAGDRGLAMADNDAAIGWLRANIREGDVVLVKASRGSRLDLIADALVEYE